MSIVVDIKHHARAQVSNSIVVPMLTALYGEEDSRYGKLQYQTMIPPLQGLYTIVMSIMDTVGGVMSIMDTVGGVMSIMDTVGGVMSIMDSVGGVMSIMHEYKLMDIRFKLSSQVYGV